MLNDILTASGLLYAEARYPDPPEDETYAVYFDNVTKTGPDPIPGIGLPCILTHDCMVELYEPIQDPTAEADLEAQLDARGLEYTKQARYWLQNVQRYQVIYEFTYTEKRRT